MMALRRPERISTLCWIALLATSLQWFNHETTVLGGTNELVKFAVWALAVAGALLARTRSSRFDLGAPFLALLAYVSTSVIGALLGSAEIASLARAVHLVITIFAIRWIISRIGLLRMVQVFILFGIGISGSALVAFLLGLTTRESGRLAGGIPPHLHPNELALVTAFSFVCCLALWAEHRLTTTFALAASGLFLVVLLMTGSRTSIAAFLLALAALLGRSTRVRGAVVVWFAIVTVLTVALVQPATASRVWSNVATRNGTVTLGENIQSRALAWNSVIHVQTRTGSILFGQGLAIKKVPVQNRFVSVQTVDSSWYSAYLQTGLIGTLMLALAAVSALVLSVRSRNPLLIGLMIALLISSWFESTLNDVTPSLMIFSAVALSWAPRARATVSSLITERASTPDSRKPNRADYHVG